ncbi:hypothetical protein FCULG_00002861 [Fusarium culmorum]|uniref:BTB domain-containing protein n=1 Tax=Fusarium culmorum TaxID=5516 RepID=A0A2T4H6J9_FUSCU|nr:hypothetical protein FCULG_00002861 [Fusarium culmorum]
MSSIRLFTSFWRVVFQDFYDTSNNRVSPVDIEMKFLVSSRYLTLTSGTFRAMLKGPWAEGSSPSQLPRQIHATDWDPLAFAIVLDIRF